MGKFLLLSIVLLAIFLVTPCLRASEIPNTTLIIESYSYNSETGATSFTVQNTSNYTLQLDYFTVQYPDSSSGSNLLPYNYFLAPNQTMLLTNDWQPSATQNVPPVQIDVYALGGQYAETSVTMPNDNTGIISISLSILGAAVVGFALFSFYRRSKRSDSRAGLNGKAALVEETPAQGMVAKKIDSSKRNSWRDFIYALFGAIKLRWSAKENISRRPIELELITSLIAVLSLATFIYGVIISTAGDVSLFSPFLYAVLSFSEMYRYYLYSSVITPLVIFVSFLGGSLAWGLWNSKRFAWLLSTVLSSIGIIITIILAFSVAPKLIVIAIPLAIIVLILVKPNIRSHYAMKP
jgi:hypothetical protein